MQITHTRTLLAALTAALLTWTGGLAMAQERFGNDLGPDPIEAWEGEVDYAATAGTLLTCQDFFGSSVCEAVPSSTAAMVGVPGTRRIVKALLIWTASKEYQTPNDLSVDLTMPGGTPQEVTASPDEVETIDLDDLMAPPFGTFQASWFTARADITDQLTQHVDQGGDLNGPWSVGGLNIAHGSLQNLTSIWVLGSLAVGGWSVLIIHEPVESTGFRKLYLYTGFEWLSAGSLTLSPSGFVVPATPNARFTIHILEGDSNITGDSIAFNGATLNDACNTSTNAFNDTVNTNTGGACRTRIFGVDLDTFTVGDHLDPGDEEATLSLSVPREQIFTNYLIVAFDSVPEFLKPTKLAQPSSGTPVSIGQQITYTIALQNRGTGPASNVVITDPTPAGTRYVAGTALLDQQTPIGDPSPGVSPLQRGLRLDPLIGGPMPHEGPGASRTLSFTVEVTSAPEGRAIINEATIDADGIETVPTNLTTHPVAMDDPPDAGMEPDAAEPEPQPEPDAGSPDDAGDGEVDNPEPEPTPEPQPQPEPNPEPEANPDPNICGPGTTLRDGQCVPICGPGTSFVDGLCVANAQDTLDDGCGCRLASPHARGAPWPLWALAALALALLTRKKHE